MANPPPAERETSHLRALDKGTSLVLELVQQVVRAELATFTTSLESGLRATLLARVHDATKVLAALQAACDEAAARLDMYTRVGAKTTETLQRLLDNAAALDREAREAAEEEEVDESVPDLASVLSEANKGGAADKASADDLASMLASMGLKLPT